MGKARMVFQDMDLRPRYDDIDSLKYNITACPVCGYAALTKEFPILSYGQAKMIKEKISINFTGLKYESDTYSYDDAIARSKLALVNTVVKRGKVSERAYICLTLGWLTRGKAESISKDTPNRALFVKQLAEEENEYLKKAAEGFGEALQKEYVNASSECQRYGANHSVFDQLPPVFTLEDLKALKDGHCTDHSLRMIVSRWRHDGWIEKTGSKQWKKSSKGFA
jgi:uncharacterized protein (DUF2225 family)